MVWCMFVKQERHSAQGRTALNSRAQQVVIKPHRRYCRCGVKLSCGVNLNPIRHAHGLISSCQKDSMSFIQVFA